jgi:hypothetical protein
MSDDEKARVISDRTARRKKLGLCVVCADAGEWIALALMCKRGHGKIIG